MDAIEMSREPETLNVRAQSVDQPRKSWILRGAWAGAWLAALGVPAWMARLSILALIVAALGILAWSWHAARTRDRWASLIALVLWLAVGIAVGVQLRLNEIAHDWPRVHAELDEQGATALNGALDNLVERGERAVTGVAEAVGERAAVRPSPAMFYEMERLTYSTGMSAVALFDAGGNPLAWSGEHRGTVPVAVRRGEQSYIFSEGPLFDYLYFVQPLPQGRTAMAAILLEADLDVGEGSGPFAEWFAERHGLTPRFTLPERAQGASVWDWSVDQPILSVSFEALTQQHWWDRVVERGLRGVGIAWLLAFTLLGTVWYQRRMGSPGIPVAVATLGLFMLPLGRVVGAEDLFSPLQFVLSVPGPWDITLGLLLILLIGATVWMLTRKVGGPESGRALPVLLLAPAFLFPLVISTVERSAGDGWLASHPAGGFALQLATILLLAIPTYVLLQTGRRPVIRAPRLPMLILGVVTSLALGIGVVLLWHPERPFSPWLAGLWAIPVAAVGSALPQFGSPGSSLRVWLVAGWLGATAALPFLWTLHVGAELANAERELAELGTRPNPFLDFLLRQFAEQATAYAREGEEGVNLLYHSWVGSGLAREGYEARITMWREGRAETELRLTELQAIPAVVQQMVDSASLRTEPLVRQYHRVEGLHYLLLVPLPGGRVISVAVPPRYRIGRATALARFLQADTEEEAAATNESLYLVPSSSGPAGAAGKLASTDPEPVQWSRIEGGWRSEARARFPSGWMHAHLLLRTDAAGMLVVRATLTLSAVLATFGLLWLLARLLCGEPPIVPFLRRQWVRSFRGRLTIALFFFFLLPTTFFGAVAYGAVSREVTLSAANLARRALEQAVPEVSSGTPLAATGSQVRSDLLLYRQGTLAGASAPEILDLGLFHTWLPPEVFLTFSTGQDLEEREERRLGENEYLVAYRRVDPVQVLAAPIPLASHEISRRQRDFAHVALVVSLLGAALSVVLSLLVGRALTRPLDELSAAVATVGSGNLRVRLPEGRPDEFGRVYGAFNRMVRRLNHARAALMRETRRTETIVAEAATGVLALDAHGDVELVNPRASEILGCELETGGPLPRNGALLAALADAVSEFWRARSDEAGMELEIEGRIVRLRLRRLMEGEERRGAVVALEDVTDEVRTARVLAWGEMARQVAHEIKNPLTPIKLSVQHLRRAFADGRPDFGAILDRNVESILREIDRLGEIARAFARFGTPQQDVAELERVDVARAIEETLVLYRSGGGGIRFEADLNGGAPLHATARIGELKEVLVNLLENAREALNGSGEIRVSAVPSMDGRRVEVMVADTGEGIPAELLPRIFEPHFSTRTSGTGLGLAIVRRLVDSWGGEIFAESQPGVGTRIRLILQSWKDG